MPLPSSIQSFTLKITKGNPPTLVGTQTIPLGSINVGVGTTNRVKIDSNITNAFSTEPVGTIFTPSIVVDYGNNLTIANLPASNVPSFVPRPAPLSRLANGETIRHNGLVTDIPSSTPLFIYANPRGKETGPEWFAVVKDGMKNKITDYASDPSFYSDPFIPPGQTEAVPFNNIVTTHMTDMSSLLTPYNGFQSFNHDISSWDTSKVTNMSSMFQNNWSFNQDIASWDTSKVTNMSLMFSNCQLFNKPIGSWNTSNVTDMNNIFGNCHAFNQPIGSWNTSKVTNMFYMFLAARAFNQNISSWNTSNVTNMGGMFWAANVFNQPIGSWDTSNVTDMVNMFNETRAFNQNISSWQVYRLTSRPNKPVGFTGTTAFLANPSYSNLLPNWGMAAPVL
jgi:surface protein